MLFNQLTITLNVVFQTIVITFAIRIIKFTARFGNSSSIFAGPKFHEYDFIIVGSGTAGSTILTGISNRYRVLCIEAGQNGNFLIDMPFVTPLIQKSEYDWNLFATFTSHACQAMNDGICRLSSGRGFGGSNLLNNMIYHRGHPDDYRSWFVNAGEPYNFERDILPDFIKTEELLSITKGNYLSEFGNELLTFDYPEFSTNLHFEAVNLTQKFGMRWSMAHLYRNSPKLHKNREILLQQYVNRVVFGYARDSTEAIIKRATGVEIIRSDGQLYEISARLGVILCAGTFNSPEILWRSGLNRSHLPQLGRNLQDHIMTGFDLIKINVTNGFNLSELFFSPRNLYKYFFQNGNGPFSSVGCEILGFKFENATNKSPNLGFMFLPMGLTIDSGIKIRDNLNLNATLWSEYYGNLIRTKTAGTISLMPILLRPKSRGHLEFSSKNNRVEIHTNYLKHPEDMETLISGIRIVQNLLKHRKLWKNFGAELWTKPFPPCENHAADSDEYWTCYCRHLTFSVYHPVGTCQMGCRSNDSVVDRQTFQVHGTQRLFIVDASIMPNLPSANPNAAVAMLAQRFLRLQKLTDYQTTDNTNFFDRIKNEL